MARPKSLDKRNAILAAAAEVFADRGLSAATSAISSAAGVAEGTLFTYFKSKDDLVNALYRELKLEIADAMMSGFPRKKSVRDRLHHVWDRYIDWGLANPVKHNALHQIEVWGGLTEESKMAGSAPFAEIQIMAEEAVSQRILQDLPQRFFSSTMSALIENSIALIRQDPEQAEAYRSAGFEMLWAGMARKR